MYFNVTEKLASGASASSAYSHNVPVQNFDNFAVQVVWTGVDTAAGTLKLMGGSVDSTSESAFSILTDDVTTMCASGGSVATNDNALFNVTDCAYNYVKVVYTPVLNAAGGFLSDLTVMRLGDGHFRVVGAVLALTCAGLFAVAAAKALILLVPLHLMLIWVGGERAVGDGELHLAAGNRLQAAEPQLPRSGRLRAGR